MEGKILVATNPTLKLELKLEETCFAIFFLLSFLKDCAFFPQLHPFFTCVLTMFLCYILFKKILVMSVT